jgi:tetratricopeptide (TPR) repeat protein
MNALAKWWNNQKAHSLLLSGTTNAMKGNYPIAITQLTQVIEINPDLLDAYLHRGIAYIESGEISRALPDFDAVLKKDPEFMLAYYNRSIAFCELKDFNRAMEDANRAVQLAPSDPKVYNHRAILHSQRGESDAAIADATMEIQLGHKSSGYTNRAVVRWKNGDYASAASDWMEVILREPNNAKAYCLRGLALEKTGNRDEAIVELRKGLQRKDDLFPEIRVRTEEALQRLTNVS